MCTCVYMYTGRSRKYFCSVSLKKIDVETFRNLAGTYVRRRRLEAETRHEREERLQQLSAAQVRS